MNHTNMRTNMKRSRALLLFGLWCVIFAALVASSAADEVVRPMIWVTPAEATLVPLLAADLANVPYFVVRRTT